MRVQVCVCRVYTHTRIVHRELTNKAVQYSMKQFSVMVLESVARDERCSTL